MNWKGKKRYPFDVENLLSVGANSKCFVCEFLSGNPNFVHIEVLRTESAVAFLDRYPTVFGRVIVAPTHHLEELTGDFEKSQYLQLQEMIFDVAEGVRKVLDPERVYVLSLGSKAANAHVHWHIVPLPSGLPLSEQQFHVLMHENGAIETNADEQQEYAEAIRDSVLGRGI